MDTGRKWFLKMLYYEKHDDRNNLPISRPSEIRIQSVVENDAFLIRMVPT